MLTHIPLIREYPILQVSSLISEKPLPVRMPFVLVIIFDPEMQKLEPPPPPASVTLPP